tara:strand:+ start:7182 stop:7877 length:696 start_codon:yes stop_codon:yes gene_type:complete
MALPKLTAPKYQIEVPSTKKMIEYRPFLVKEEKVLMMAQESEDPKQLQSAVEDIIETCTYGAIKPSELTAYDLEYIFLNLRAVSVGETVEVGIKCEHCDKVNQIVVNLKEIKVQFPEVEPETTIMLEKDIGITMKPITLGATKLLADDAEITDMVGLVIDTIFDKDNVYPTKDSTVEEIKDFVESLNREQLGKIQEYISNQPKLIHTVEFKCIHCGEMNKITLEGLQSFFA